MNPYYCYQPTTFFDSFFFTGHDDGFFPVFWELDAMLLLGLDAARGVSERRWRRRATRKVLALQDAVDALQPKAPLAEAEIPVDVNVTETAEHGEEINVKAAAEETEADGELPDAAEKAVPASDAASADAEGDKPGSDDEWEMVKEEYDAVAPAVAALRQEIMMSAADAGAGVVDTGKLMQMVAALCEQNAQLAERVDSLERTVRLMEDAERRD